MLYAQAMHVAAAQEVTMRLLPALRKLQVCKLIRCSTLDSETVHKNPWYPLKNKFMSIPSQSLVST